MYHRAVLVPVWRHVNLNVVVLQTRGDDFVKQCTLDNLQYEVDTVERDGSVSTQVVQLAGVASLGVAAQKAAFFGRIPELTHLRYVGVGVTEAGIHPSSQAMKDLAAFLVALVEYFPAMVYALALSRLPTTAAAPPVVFTYLDGLVQKDLAPGLLAHGLSYGVIQEVYKDWIHRLKHKYFGMDTFFVAQNAWTKYTIRLLATIAPHVQAGEVPSLLREASASGSVEDTTDMMRTLLRRWGGYDDADDRWRTFAANVAVMYRRFLTVPPTPVLDVLTELVAQSTEALKDELAIATYVADSVASTWAIDVHTHLFPPSHDALMLWGIDALLTYHYLVAEYLMTAPVAPETFLAWPKTKQADAIWTHLFVDRSPLSEACQGVVTTLNLLGLSALVKTRDLPAIREPNAYVDLVFRLAKIRYVVMTNIPFDPQEASYWTNHTPYNARQFRTALRVDQLLLGDWASLGPALDLQHLPHTLAGVTQYLESWVDILRPVYFMASVPATFALRESAAADPIAIQPDGAMLLQHVLLPLAQSRRLPVALKFGAVRQLNPRY
ncbi:hypothetical protein DYB25_006257 [Aphanomyces astaci]|uniref:Uncharacterized protein n=1 Tax=Aphanomyces astaci TaxID=112090 RepID=A0A397AH72_APHAT|nr:hypothetical protein DYB25_006257 [Aphanomyces astaci]